MMNLLSPLASLLGIEIEELTERFRKDAIAWSAVALFGFIGLTFLLVAAHAALTAWIGPIWGPLAIAGASIIVALGVFAAIRITDSIAQRRAAERRRSAERTALVTTAAISALPMVLNSDLMKKIGIPVGGALAAAFLLSMPGRASRHHDKSEAND